MKTILQWLQELPPGYRERALQQTPSDRSHVLQANLSWALVGAFSWARSNEGHEFWRAVSGYYHELNDELPPLPDSPHDVESPNQKQHTTTHMNYANTPVATPTLVYGEDVADMTEARCMQVIKSLQAEAKDLAELGIASPTVEKRIAERKAALEAVVARLNTFA